MTSSTEYVQADVVIIGGGFAGSWAALRAAELGADVVLVDKAFVSRSGASTMSGGVTTAPLDGEDLRPWVREFVLRGDYMCDQDWTWQLLEGARERIKTLDSWDVGVYKDEQGQIRRFSSRGMVDVRCMQYLPKKAMTELRRRNLASGVRILDRVNIVDLLTTDGAYPTTGSVCGAVGFNARDGRLIVLRGKQTILACGPLVKKGKLHIDNVVGDGAALAYRAGARLVDLELGNGGTFAQLMKHYDLGGYNIAVAHGARLINALGERFMEKYDAVRFERSELTRVVAAFVKEIVDGRGPVYIDLRHCDAAYWEDLKTLSQGETLVILSGLVPDPRVHPLLIEPNWGQRSHGIGGVDIDLRCRASLPGLLAAGATAKNRATGTHASAGIPTTFAMNSGYFAGETAALAARDLPLADLPRDAVAAFSEAIFAPLSRPDSGCTPDDLHDRLSMLENNVVDGIVVNAAKLERRLSSLESLGDDLSRVRADNLHELVKFFDARNVVDSAGIQCRLAIDRTESRESFYREDYPETNDEDWFCWHGATRTEQGVRFDRERIPLERYEFQPPEGPKKRLSAIAAIMRGCYDPAVYA